MQKRENKETHRFAQLPADTSCDWAMFGYFEVNIVKTGQKTCSPGVTSRSTNQHVLQTPLQKKRLTRRSHQGVVIRP